MKAWASGVLHGGITGIHDYGGLEEMKLGAWGNSSSCQASIPVSCQVNQGGAERTPPKGFPQTLLAIQPLTHQNILIGSSVTLWDKEPPAPFLQETLPQDKMGHLTLLDIFTLQPAFSIAQSCVSLGHA